jgi:hypothetical protein
MEKPIEVGPSLQLVDTGGSVSQQPDNEHLMRPAPCTLLPAFSHLKIKNVSFEHEYE